MHLPMHNSRFVVEVGQSTRSVFDDGPRIACNERCASTESEM